MKSYAPFFIAFFSFVFTCSFAQPSENSIPNASIASNDLALLDELKSNADAIASYYVEEHINMNFGGRITTYEVSSLSLISTQDLGPNNVRVIKPKYLKAKPVVTKKLDIQPIAMKAETLKPKAVEFIVPVRKKDYVEIDLTSTYERILEKGYDSVDMLYKVANRHFFNGDLVVAAKWYSKLFALSKEVDSVYNYRFAQCLKAIGQNEKANQMMTIFENSTKSK